MGVTKQTTMTQEQIIAEGNKNIAFFMGGVLQDDAHGHTKRNIFFREALMGLHLYNAFQLKYHSSWDWLMPVVEKILKQQYTEHVALLQGALTQADITLIYDQVVRCANWYNSQQNTLKGE